MKTSAKIKHETIHPPVKHIIKLDNDFTLEWTDNDFYSSSVVLEVSDEHATVGYSLTKPQLLDVCRTFITENFEQLRSPFKYKYDNPPTFELGGHNCPISANVLAQCIYRNGDKDTCIFCEEPSERK